MQLVQPRQIWMQENILAPRLLTDIEHYMLVGSAIRGGLTP